MRRMRITGIFEGSLGSQEAEAEVRGCRFCIYMLDGLGDRCATAWPTDS